MIIEQWLVNIKKTLLNLGAKGELPKLSHQQLKKIIENQQLNKDESLDEKPYLFKTHFDKFILGIYI